MNARHVLLVLAVTAALAGAPVGALAQDETQGASFITPFPAGDIYNVLVIGDDLADGLLYGLLEAFQGDTRLQVRNRHHLINGLMRSDFDEKLVQLDEDLKKEPANIAIVMLGAWDRVAVRDASGKRVRVGTEPWRAEYGSRADRLMKLLKRANVAVYWVGLPNVARYEANEDARMMNDVVRERAYLNGLKYIDAYAGFLDEAGGYSAYGPDITGRMRLLREGDGVYFTAAGNRKLAHFVERDLKRDLTQAKAERSIPLAGSEEEQAKINPDKAKLAAAQSAAQEAAKPGPQGSAAPAVPVAPAPQAVARGAGEQKADNGRINLRMVSPSGREEMATVDIVRPAISASVVALVTRRESPDKPSMMGEAIVEQIPGGLTVINTIALANAADPSGRRRLSPAQTPYFRVLFKGERLAPKRGRADDTSWPRVQTSAASASPRSKPLETGATLRPEPAKRPQARPAAPADTTP
jgi:hypothetical protein